MKLDLVENRPRRYALSQRQLAILREALPELSIHVTGVDGEYDLVAGSAIGSVEIGDLQVTIAPKVPISNVLFMMAYTIDGRYWRSMADFTAINDPLEAIAGAFAVEVNRLVTRGLIRKYRPQRAAESVVRGRIRLDQQLTKWWGRVPPIECEYDVFTEDVLENRLLKSAARVLQALPLRNISTRDLLAHALGALQDVEDVWFSPAAVPEVRYNRLTERARRPIELARLVLRYAALSPLTGGLRASGFLIDMSEVFESFVRGTLQDGLRRIGAQVSIAKEQFHLDLGDRLRLVPDLVIRRQSTIVGVGDVKYKRPTAKGVINADVYQVVAYAISGQTRDAFLIYPENEWNLEEKRYRVKHSEVTVRAFVIDLAAPPEYILEELDRLALMCAAEVGLAA